MQGTPDPNDPTLQAQRQMVRLAEQTIQVSSVLSAFGKDLANVARSLGVTHLMGDRGHVVVPAESVVGYQGVDTGAPLNPPSGGSSAQPSPLGYRCAQCGKDVAFVNSADMCMICDPVVMGPKREGVEDDPYSREAMNDLVRIAQRVLSVNERMAVQNVERMTMVPTYVLNDLALFLSRWHVAGGSAPPKPPARDPFPPEEWRRVQP